MPRAMRLLALLIVIASTPFAFADNNECGECWVRQTPRGNRFVCRGGVDQDWCTVADDGSWCIDGSGGCVWPLNGGGRNNHPTPRIGADERMLLTPAYPKSEAAARLKPEGGHQPR